MNKNRKAYVVESDLQKFYYYETISREKEKEWKKTVRNENIFESTGDCIIDFFEKIIDNIIP